MKTFKLDIQAVLEKELYGAPPLIPVVVAKVIGSSKDIPKVFRLTKDIATADLKHLRRIRNLPESQIECIICKVNPGNQSSSFEDQLKELEIKFGQENIFKEYRIAHVPSVAPRTDQQLKACADIWPCKFAKSLYLIQCIEGSIFNEAEMLVLKIIVNNVLSHIEQHQHLKSGAVVFRCAKVYGVGLSGQGTVESNPIKHSTMLSIDSVATNAGSGHWKCSDAEKVMNKIQERLDSEEKLKDHRIDANFLPYLCTNYDIFVTEEPCFMCSMGLVQSRIRRLFYLDSKSLEYLSQCQRLCYPDKAIELHLVHRDRNLNHRFEAWRISLQVEE